jgi:DNA-binding transcriptional LysR family regulator
MELRQLQYFVAVADAGHFGRAAQRLHIVQPAVSQQVARLERELGLPLFDRSRRQISLTAEGRAFLAHARRVLHAVDQAGRAAEDLRAGRGGLLRVGSSEVLGDRLDAILAAFRRRHPETAVELQRGPTPVKLAQVAAGDLDAAFVRAPEPTAGVEVAPLWQEPLLAAVPAARIPGQGTGGPDADPVELAELADLPVSLAERAANPGVFDRITAACHAAGFTPLPGPPFGTVQDVLAAHVAAGRCWTLLYAATPTAGLPRGVTLRPTRPALTVPTGLAVAAAPRRPLVDQFLATARELAD